MNTTDILSEPLGGLSRNEWFRRLERLCEDEGSYEPIGDRHTSVFIDRSPSVLLVTFEEAEEVRLVNNNGQPIAFPLAIARDWSNLCILAHGETWYRDEALYRYFDRLVDDGLFEDFDHVVFYGAEMGAYGAAAYSVTAPGASVFAIQPVASLTGSVAAWDPRFRDKRHLDFTSRYGFAPRMIEGASKAFICYDPYETLDAMHASMFHDHSVVHLRCPHLGGQIESDFDHMGLMGRLLAMIGEDRLTRESFYQLYRQRREHAFFLRRLLDKLEDDDRPYLAAMLSRNAARRLHRRRFHESYQAARAKLAERGIPWDDRASR